MQIPRAGRNRGKCKKRVGPRTRERSNPGLALPSLAPDHHRSEEKVERPFDSTIWHRAFVRWYSLAWKGVAFKRSKCKQCEWDDETWSPLKTHRLKWWDLLNELCVIWIFCRSICLCMLHVKLINYESAYFLLPSTQVGLQYRDKNSKLHY